MILLIPCSVPHRTQGLKGQSERRSQALAWHGQARVLHGQEYRLHLHQQGACDSPQRI